MPAAPPRASRLRRDFQRQQVVRVPSRHISPSPTKHAFVIGYSATGVHPSVELLRRRAYHFRPSKRIRRRMSKIDRHSDFTPSPSPHEQRILMRVLGCGVEELVTRFGAENAIKRVETETDERRNHEARTNRPGHGRAEQ